MMNGDLVIASEQKIIIPTVYRNNYLSALKALSQTGKSTPIIQILDFAQRYTSAIPWSEFDRARSTLQATNAFRDSTEAEESGIQCHAHARARHLTLLNSSSFQPPRFYQEKFYPTIGPSRNK